MTSVNSPASLLACNHFYRNSSTSPDSTASVFSHQNNADGHKQRQITLCITMATPPGFPGGIRTNSLWVNIDLGFPTSLPFATSKPTTPADRGVK